jgi:hypothetical protein
MFSWIKRGIGLATISIVVHREWNLTERVVVGELTLADVMSELNRFYDGPITKHVLWNLEEATFGMLNPIDVERISLAAAPMVKNRASGKSAVVATSDLGYGFSRMYQAYREINMVTLPYKSFRVRQEAIDWLLSD